ncbi:MAG: LytR family transcriptional regulator, partial [Clostridiales bacterium]|nr:LytR family transcriptional regulator [Clostridiales bacterium]
MAKARKRKKKKTLARILFIEFVILLLLIGAVKVYNTLEKIQHDDSEDKNIVQNEIEEKEGFHNIVIFGVDSRQNKLDKGTHT